MAKTITKIILVAQIILVTLPLFGLVGFGGLFSGIYDNLIKFLIVIIPLFIAGSVLAYFAKSRSLLYSHVFFLFLAFAVLVLSRMGSNWN